MKFTSYLFYLILIGFCFLSSCTSQTQKQDVETYFNAVGDSIIESSVSYAKGFDIYQKENITKIVVFHPELNELIVGTYYVTDSLTALKFYDTVNVFVYPVDRLAIFTATQMNAIDLLGQLDRIVGVSEAAYIKNKIVREKIEEGSIVELAGNGDFFVERTLTVKPKIIFYSPYRLTETHPLEITKIPLIPFYDYFETDPLGRAEWIKFTAAFLGLENKADSMFTSIVDQYEKYRKVAERVDIKPTVFSDKYFNGQWYIPGGESYIAEIFKDAGSDYIWKNDPHIASFPLDYEVVFSKAHDADFWRIMLSYGDAPTYESLAAENGLYKHFKAFQDKNIIWCDAEKTAYFEKSPLEPHLLLADLIKAFHPNLLPDYHPSYYKVLK